MDKLIINDKSFKPYIAENTIQNAVIKVATKINIDYSNLNPLFVSVLNGSFMFTSDLMKALDIACNVTFVKFNSYSGTTTTGKVDELIGLNEDISARDVIVIEDIVDTGNTWENLHEILTKQNPKSLKVATLLYKPSTYIKTHKIDYIGIEIPNTFVVGYGLDYRGLGRNLSSIYALND